MRVNQHFSMGATILLSVADVAQLQRELAVTDTIAGGVLATLERLLKATLLPTPTATPMDTVKTG